MSEHIKEIAKQMFEFNDNEVARVDMVDICRFADYVDAQAAARERETCAALCDDWFASTAGRAIRERGEK
jgi:hypothetical protein